jgi:hypothetical protein
MWVTYRENSAVVDEDTSEVDSLSEDNSLVLAFAKHPTAH